MTTHPHLERGLTILHTRLAAPGGGADTRHAPASRPFVTLSREACAGATSLGHALLPLLDAEFKAEDRSWMFLDKDLLNRALSRHALPERLAEFLPEDRVPEVQALIGELVGLHPPLWQLEQKVSEAILQIARHGHVIFAGRAAHEVTQFLAGGFHVRLVASLPARIRRMQDMQHCAADEAERRIGALDQARQRYVRTLFDTDVGDPHAYDLVINTDRIPPHQAAHLIMEALRTRVPAARS